MRRVQQTPSSRPPDSVSGLANAGATYPDGIPSESSMPPMQQPQPCNPQKPISASAIPGPTHPACISSDAFCLALETLHREHERQLEELRSTLLHESMCMSAPELIPVLKTGTVRMQPLGGRSNSDTLANKENSLAKDFVRDLQTKHPHPHGLIPEGNNTTLLTAEDLRKSAYEKGQFCELRAALGWTDRFGSVVRPPSGHVGTSQMRKIIRRIVDNMFFETWCAVVILVNTAFLGVAADQAAKNSDPEAVPSFQSISSKCFSCWFACELVLRLLAYGRDFFTSAKRGWNIFDLLVVTVDLGMMLLSVLTEIPGNQFSSLLRSLRALRVTRAIRLFRLIHFVRELRMMIASVVSSAPSLVWSLVLFFAVSYIFGVYLMASVTSYLHTSGPEAEHFTEMKRRFGSMDKTLYTLFITAFGGISWYEISDPLLDIHWTNALLFCFYVFFESIAVMNIVTGIFVDSAIQAARSDKDEIIQEQLHHQKSELAILRQIFNECDDDGSGFLTLQEFDTHMRSSHVQGQFAALGISVEEAWGCFRLLDTDDSGTISVDEFITGCMRMKGNASAVDVATLLYENKRMTRIITHYNKQTEASFKRIHAWQVDILNLCSVVLGIDSHTLEQAQEPEEK